MASVTNESIYWENIAKQYGLASPVPYWGGARRVHFDNAAKGKNFYPRVLAAQSAGYPSATMEDILYYEKVSNPVYIAEQERLEEARQLAIRIENERLALITKNDNIALALFEKLKEKRIKNQQDEFVRLAQVKESQRLAEIQAEKFKAELLLDQEKQIISAKIKAQEIMDLKESDRINKTIPLLMTVFPITAIGILLLYSGKGKK